MTCPSKKSAGRIVGIYSSDLLARASSVSVCGLLAWRVNLPASHCSDFEPNETSISDRRINMATANSHAVDSCSHIDQRRLDHHRHNPKARQAREVIEIDSDGDVILEFTSFLLLDSFFTHFCPQETVRVGISRPSKQCQVVSKACHSPTRR